MEGVGRGMKALSYDDVSLVPRFNNIPSRNDVDTGVMLGNLKLAVPVISSNMNTVTGELMARTMRQQGGIGCLHRFCSIEENVAMYKRAVAQERLTENERPVRHEAIVSIGVNEGLDRVRALYDIGARYFCIDVAHGHSRAVGDLLKAIRTESLEWSRKEEIARHIDPIYLIAGNVCTAVGAEYLAECGADAIKIGVGPGSVCSTRVKTGFGIPQFTAILNCSRVNVFKIADGGIRDSGDAVKAFAAGADAVMLGGMLAGCDETPGETYAYKIASDAYGERPIGEPFKVFRGMASKEAQDEYMGGMSSWKAAEGVEIKVEVKGPVANVMAAMMGGIHSGMTYAGANTIRQIRERAAYVEITAAGALEGRPHGQGRL